jgi:hypothetical protein
MTIQYRACALHAGQLRLRTHSEYMTVISFSRHKWLRECASVLRYTYTACLIYRSLDRLFFRCEKQILCGPERHNIMVPWLQVIAELILRLIIGSIYPLTFLPLTILWQHSACDFCGSCLIAACVLCIVTSLYESLHFLTLVQKSNWCS